LALLTKNIIFILITDTFRLLPLLLNKVTRINMFSIYFKISLSRAKYWRFNDILRCLAVMC
jgi:hypothetical protein